MVTLDDWCWLKIPRNSIAFSNSQDDQLSVGLIASMIALHRSRRGPGFEFRSRKNFSGFPVAHVTAVI